MKKRKYFSLVMILFLIFNFFIVSFAGSLDVNIPVPYSASLSDSGTVAWSCDESRKYKNFHVKLLKRFLTSTSATGIPYYDYKDYGTQKTADGSERSCDINIGSVGYYRVKVRCVDLSGNYSDWTESTVDVEIDAEHTSGGGGSGGNNDWGYGPGTGGYYPYMNNGGYYYNGYFYPNVQSQVIGPDGMIVNPNNTYPQGVSPGTNVNNNFGNYNNNNYNNNNGQVIIPNPNMNNNTNNNNSNSNLSPIINNNTEVGWHVDGNGKFFYQGNGVYLKNCWCLIEGNYYRFNENGYVLTNKWFLDPTNNSYYLLDGEGKMATGWQRYSGSWYYLNPMKGNTYGVMYCDAVLNIDGKVYAFSSSGAMVKNAWYNGSYYGSDGSRIS